MKRIFLSGMITCCAALITNIGLAQTKNQVQKNEEIIIRKNNDSDSKMVVVIDSNVITINGQPLADYKGDVRVLKRDRLMNRDFESLSDEPRMNFKTININASKAFLGVLTEKSDKGALIKSVTKESAAEKAGLKENDIITKVGDKLIATPEDLAAAVKAHKPGDELKINYLRSGKKKEAKVTLGKNNAMVFNWNGDENFVGGKNFNFKTPDLSRLDELRTFNFFDRNQPKLGLKIQDTEDGNGVKILNVEEGSAAEKAGLKKDDLITELNGQKVNSVSEVREQLSSAENKTKYSIKAKRNNSEMNFDVQVPKQLKSADL